MDTRYWTKHNLYNSVDELIDCMGIPITEASYPLQSINLAKEFCTNLELKILPFPTPAICGILCKEDSRTAIALNKNRDKTMHNFDCMHELIHYFLHDGNEFNCIYTDLSQMKQDRFIEWQANEGAAQALVPYQIFIPKYVALSKKYAKSPWDLVDTISKLADYFHVSPKVISNRINNLDYEIKQYIDGVSLYDLKFYSKNKITKLGLAKKSTASRHYCTKCLSIIHKDHKFCLACGTNLKKRENNFKFKIWRGVGYMTYEGIALDKTGRVLKCPKCGNEEILPNSEYCKICKSPVLNKCGGDWRNDYPEDETWLQGCDTLLEGNARYCPYCGKRSTFYRLGLLNDWDYNPNRYNNEEISF